jgi:hypothetical protein
MDEQTKADMAARTGCIAGALTETEFRTTLTTAGFQEIEIIAIRPSCGNYFRYPSQSTSRGPC